MNKFGTITGATGIVLSTFTTGLSADQLKLSEDAKYSLNKSEEKADLTIPGSSDKDKSRQIIYTVGDLYKKYLLEVADYTNASFLNFTRFIFKNQAESHAEAANYFGQKNSKEFPLGVNLSTNISEQVTLQLIACSPVKKTLVETSDGKNWTALTEETKKQYALPDLVKAEKECIKNTNFPNN